MVVAEINTDNLFIMKYGELKKSLVNDLREQYKLLGLDTKGNKQLLIDRLSEVREDKLSYLPVNQVSPERTKLVNNGFTSLACW